MSDKIYTTSTSEGTNDSISIRREFQLKLKNFSKKEIEEFISTINWFCKCNDTEKTHISNAVILVSLRVNPKQTFVGTFDIDEAVYEKITPDFVKAFQAECWYQYKKKFHNSLNIDLQDDECKKAMKSLDEKADDGGIISYIVFKKISFCINKTRFDADDYERNYSLLKREEENNYFGGLKNLVHEDDIARLLKAYHNEIADLLKSMWDAKSIQSTESQKVEILPAVHGDVGSYNSSKPPKNFSPNNQKIPTPAEVHVIQNEKLPPADVDPVIRGIVKWVDATRKMEKMTGYKAEVLAAKYLR